MNKNEFTTYSVPPWVLYILSFGILGFVSLIFQVVFARDLVLLFGLTAPAVATVLAVFFSGLALGSFIFGKISDRFSPQGGIRLYASLFIGAGLYGFLFPFIFKFLNVVIVFVNDIYKLDFSGFSIVAFILVFVLLAPPAILFGAGFPVVAKLLVHDEHAVGKGISLLYFANTLGSVLGAAAAGFWLVPMFGNTVTFLSAAVLAVVVGSLVWFLPAAEEGPVLEQEGLPADGVQEPSVGRSWFAYVLFTTGFLALALEVVYTKTLVLVIGSSTYAFSLMLIAFLAGISLGSLVIAAVVDKIRRGYAFFGLFLGLIGFWLFLTIKFFERLPFWYLNIFKSYDSFDFSAIVSAQALMAFLVIFPATFLMGITFSLGIKLARPGMNDMGEAIGRLYFANTLGGVLGSLLAGFVLLPVIGYQWTLTVLIIGYFVLGGFFLYKEQLLDYSIRFILIFFLILWGLFGMFSASWSKATLILGPFVYAPNYISAGEAAIQKLSQGIDKILFYKEGLSNVAVIQRSHDLLLRVDGKTDASSGLADLEPEILIGALPMLFHPDPENVLVIGLGSGITLGAITQFESVKQIDMVEISPSIVEAADFFKEVNHDALNDPRVNMILADARNYLYLSDKKYDVISSEPSNLWVSGNVYLFTKEYYDLAKSRLNGDGLMLQWIHSYALSPDDLKTVFKTFQESFPTAYLFSAVNSGDLFLIGSPQRGASILDMNELNKKFADQKIKDELERIYVLNPYELMSYFVAGGETLRAFSEDAAINTDDNTLLEFTTPRSMYASVIPEVSAEILSLRESATMSDFIIGDSNPALLSSYLAYRMKLIPTQIALSLGDLDGAIDSYAEAKKAGLSQHLLEANILQTCNVRALVAEQAEGEEASNKIWEKCSTVFNTIEAGNKAPL